MLNDSNITLGDRSDDEEEEGCSNYQAFLADRAGSAKTGAGTGAGDNSTIKELAASMTQLAQLMASGQQTSQQTCQSIERLILQGKGKEATKKRRKEEDWRSEGKELRRATVDLEDDCHEVLCWEARRMGNPNGKPDDWWTKEVPVKTGPMLGANLVVDHLMAGRIHEVTACKIYDRTEPLELKHFLTKNSGHLGALYLYFCIS